METLTEQQINEKLDRLVEAAFLIPLLGAAARTAAPHVVKFLGRALAKGAPKLAKTAAKTAMKHPGKAAVGGYLATHPDTAKDVYDTAKGAYETGKDVAEAGKKFADNVKEAKGKLKTLADMVGTTLNKENLAMIAKAIVKYGLPVAAVMAILYGGKKLYDYMNSEEEGADIQVAESIYLPTFKEFLT